MGESGGAKDARPLHSRGVHANLEASAEARVNERDVPAIETGIKTSNRFKSVKSSDVPGLVAASVAEPILSAFNVEPHASDVDVVLLEIGDHLVDLGGSGAARWAREEITINDLEVNTNDFREEQSAVSIRFIP